MASPQRLINLLTRSVLPFRLAMKINVSANGLLPILSKRQGRQFSYPRLHFSKNMSQKGSFSSRFSLPKVDLRRRELFNGLDIASGRGYTTVEIDGKFDQAWLKSQMANLRKVYSVFFARVELGKHTVVTNVPGMKKTEIGESLCISLNMPAVNEEDVHTCIIDNHFFIECIKHETMYLAGMILPTNFNKSDLKEVMEDGLLKLTVPKVENLALRMAKSVAKFLGPSITTNKKGIAKSLCLNTKVPCVQKVKLTNEVLCVSLDMPRLEIDDVALFYKIDTFFLEVERERNHYVAGIHIPKGFHDDFGNHFSREMQNGIFKTTLSIVKDIEKKKRVVFFVQYST